MAYSLDQNPTSKNPNNAPKQSDDKDTELATRMCIQMINDKGLPILQKAVQTSKDPAQVIGQFIGQLFGMVAEKLQGMGVSPKVFLKKPGVLGGVLSFIQQKLHLNDQQVNQIYIEVMNMIKAGAMSGQGGQQGRPNTPTGPNSDQDGEGDEGPDQEEAGEDPQEEASESPQEEQAEEEQEPEEPGENEPPEPAQPSIPMKRKF